MAENIDTSPAPKTEPAAKKAPGNSGSRPEAEPIAPLTVGEADDAASLAIDQSHMEDFTNADTEPGTTEARRPPKGAYFTVLLEKPKERWQNRAYYFVLELENRDPYLVAKPVADAKKDSEDTIRPILLVRYVLMNGTEGLWPIKLNPPDGKTNKWNTSAMNILRIAESGKWVRIISKSEYRYNVSSKTMEETPPKFSTRTFQQLVNEAFPPDRVIRSLDHPIWDELANGTTK